MRKVTLVIVLLTILFAACKNNSNSGFINAEPLKIEIPDEIKGDKELVSFIRESEKSINEFALSIEKLYAEDPKLMQKEEEDMSMFEKLKLLKVAGEMAVLFGEFSTNYAEMNEKMGNYELSMTDDQAVALQTVAEAFEKRMLLLEERIKKYQE
ncbi:MAG: hypothetical protein JW735_14075 [Prolixibacteraceae bacterium]|jgi:Skp family chaperone for outer membrane proteins|nr:hypothetical protein [Prolixibacteraceae bacterium]